MRRPSARSWRRTKKLLHLAGKAQYRIVPAQVVAYGGGVGFDYTVTINRGSASGIRPQETVINGDGLVGKTTVVGRWTSTIQLADDPSSEAGIKLSGQDRTGRVRPGWRPRPADAAHRLRPVRDRDPGPAGRDTGLEPQPADRPGGAVRAGDPDRSGHRRHAAERQPEHQTGKVTPYVDYGALDVVGVVVKAPKAPIKHVSLLPASPTPAPTVTVTVTATPVPARSPADDASSSPSSGPARTVLAVAGRRLTALLAQVAVINRLPLPLRSTRPARRRGDRLRARRRSAARRRDRVLRRTGGRPDAAGRPHRRPARLRLHARRLSRRPARGRRGTLGVHDHLRRGGGFGGRRPGVRRARRPARRSDRSRRTQRPEPWLRYRCLRCDSGAVRGPARLRRARAGSSRPGLR